MAGITRAADTHPLWENLPTRCIPGHTRQVSVLSVSILLLILKKQETPPTIHQETERVNGLWHVYTVDYLPAMRMKELQTQPQPGKLTNNAEWRKQDAENTCVMTPVRWSSKLAKHSCTIWGGTQPWEEQKKSKKAMIMKVGRDGASWEAKKGHMEGSSGWGAASGVLECSISWTGWCYIGGNPFFC